MKWIIGLGLAFIIGLAVAFAYFYIVTSVFVVEAKTINISARVENKLQVKDLPYDGERLQPAYNLWSLR